LPVLSTAASTDFRIRCWASTNCRSGFTTSSLSAVANALQTDLRSVGTLPLQGYASRVYGWNVIEEWKGGGEDCISFTFYWNACRNYQLISPLAGCILKLWFNFSLLPLSTSTPWSKVLAKLTVAWLATILTYYERRDITMSFLATFEPINPLKTKLT
jgi:hypothetical protein